MELISTFWTEAMNFWTLIKIILIIYNKHRGHAVASWLRRCVTNRKVAGSRPDEVNDFYQFT
jgi:hypothetical protein